MDGLTNRQSIHIVSRKNLLREEMAKLPYRFHTPIPRYFHDTGWIYPKNPTGKNVLVWLCWAFARCYGESHNVYHDGRMLLLEPFEFIYGRNKCAEEVGLTVDEVRTIVDNLLKAGLLEKTPNSTTKRFTCYKWITSRFEDYKPQQNPQAIPNTPPTIPHKRNEETPRSLDLKDGSLGGCGKVDNKIDSTVYPTDFVDDPYKYILNNEFKDGSKVPEHVLARWLRDYSTHEIYKSLIYYQKMSSNQQINKPIAYVEAALKERYWESNDLRDGAKDKEGKFQKEKGSTIYY